MRREQQFLTSLPSETSVHWLCSKFGGRRVAFPFEVCQGKLWPMIRTEKAHRGVSSGARLLRGEVISVLCFTLGSIGNSRQHQRAQNVSLETLEDAAGG